MTGMKQPRGSAGADLLFFLFFLIVLGVVWAMTGGPSRDISREGPFLNLPFPLGSGTAYSVPSVSIPMTQGTGGSNGSLPRTNETLSDIIARLRGNVTGGTKEISPHAASTTLSAASARNTNPKTEYITIKFSKDLRGQVGISNWRIESAVTALGTTLGPASYLPLSNTGSSEVPVSASANTMVYVITGRSPTGESFRKNLCTGYFTNSQTFTPSLEKECPRPSDELKKAATIGFIPSDACIAYVNRLTTCQLVSTGFPANIEGECQNFIATSLTYNGCVSAHKNDAGFYKNEWYIYLDRDQELWKSKNEQIRLLDENGKVVATTSY